MNDCKHMKLYYADGDCTEPYPSCLLCQIASLESKLDAARKGAAEMSDDMFLALEKRYKSVCQELHDVTTARNQLALRLATAEKVRDLAVKGEGELMDVIRRLESRLGAYEFWRKRMQDVVREADAEGRAITAMELRSHIFSDAVERILESRVVERQLVATAHTRTRI